MRAGLVIMNLLLAIIWGLLFAYGLSTIDRYAGPWHYVQLAVVLLSFVIFSANTWYIARTVAKPHDRWERFKAAWKASRSPESQQPPG